jgi:hypothetical protein
MEKKKTSRKRLKKEEEQKLNSSPVCYANSKDLRAEYQDDPKPINKRIKKNS